jgi:pimeloyl-ACP methyl ester carboxylesterase
MSLKKNLFKILKDEKAEKVNIIAHSMGGLDARHMLFSDRNKEKIHERVASLTTISTPHHGTTFADWGLENLSSIIPVARALGLDLNAFSDLKTNDLTLKTLKLHAAQQSNSKPMLGSRNSGECLMRSNSHIILLKKKKVKMMGSFR